MIRTIAAALAAFVFVAFGARADEPAKADATPKAEKPAKKAKKSKKHMKKGEEKPADAAAPAAK